MQYMQYTIWKQRKAELPIQPHFSGKQFDKATANEIAHSLRLRGWIVELREGTMA